MTKKIFLLLLFINAVCPAQQKSGLVDEIGEYKNSKLLKNSSWALHAEYLDNGEIIISQNSDLSLAPASGLKLFTSAAALDLLGQDFRYKTEFYLDGKIEAGVLKGNLYVRGGGDPTFGSDLVKSSKSRDEIAEIIYTALKKKGIKSISGKIIVDVSYFENYPIPPNWNWIDLGNYYAPSVYGLNFNDNLYHLFFKPSDRAGGKAEVIRTEPAVPKLEFSNYMKTGPAGSGDNGYIYNSPLSYSAVLRGSIPAGVKEFSIKGSLPDPPLFFCEYIENYFLSRGLDIQNNPQIIFESIDYSGKELLIEIESPTVEEIVYILNKRSFNLYAEALLKTIGKVTTGEGSIKNGTAAVRKFLRELSIATDGLILTDGSGLSRTNCITAGMMVDLLSKVSKKSYFAAFYNSLGVTGDRSDIGFFKNMGIGTEIEKNARIKSGVIAGARSYSGYLKDRNGRTIAFSLIANNFDGPGSSVSGVHKNIMIELAKLR